MTRRSSAVKCIPMVRFVPTAAILPLGMYIRASTYECLDRDVLVIPDGKEEWSLPKLISHVEIIGMFIQYSLDPDLLVRFNCIKYYTSLDNGIFCFEKIYDRKTKPQPAQHWKEDV